MWERVIEHILDQLTAVTTWIQLIVSTAICYAVYLIGIRLLNWLRELQNDSTLMLKVKWLKLPWRLIMVFCGFSLFAFYLTLPEFNLLYESGRYLVTGFQTSWVKLVVITALVMLAWSLVGFLTDKITANENATREDVRRQTLKGVIESSLKVVILVIGLTLLLQVFGFNPISLLAGVGIVGLTVSFGAQNLVRDVLNGFFILLEDQYGVGDRITINVKELTGDVENLTLRVTTLRHRQTGALHIIPNGEIKKVTIERKGKNWSRVAATARVSYDDDLDKALAVFQDVCMNLYQDTQWHEDFIEPPIVQGVQELGEFEIQLRALLTVRPTKQGRIKREFNHRIKLAFDKAGLDIAPNRTTTIGNTLAIKTVDE